MAIILLNVANVEMLPVPMLPVFSFCMAHLLLSLAAAGRTPPVARPTRRTHMPEAELPRKGEGCVKTGTLRNLSIQRGGT